MVWVKLMIHSQDINQLSWLVIKGVFVNPMRKQNNKLIAFQLLVLFILFPLHIYMVEDFLAELVGSLD